MAQLSRPIKEQYTFVPRGLISYPNSMSKPSLFRPAALDANQVKWLGDIVLIRPLSFTFLTITAAVVTAALLSLLFLGSYTKRTTVQGQLVPDTGVLRVYAPQPGIVLEKRVQEGRSLKKGSVLYLISSDKQGSGPDGIQATISRQVAFRRQSLREELSQTRKLQHERDAALRKKIDALQTEQTNLINQQSGQRARIELAQAAVHRATQLSSQGYISAEMGQQKQADLLDQQNRLQSLERDRISVERQLLELQSELGSLPTQQRNELAQIERLLTSADQEWTESEGKRAIAITAPQSGIATAITVEVGQTVDGNKALISIIPVGAVLQAHLYAPSRAVGFVKPGDSVLLRYQAYPYQKFGHARGIVAYVSRTAMPPTEVLPGVNTGEALYRITVNLSSQTVLAYGKANPLQAGMLLDADILHEKRRLYEWVLEPLFSITGKL
jgi:membrane fusion protein